MHACACMQASRDLCRYFLKVVPTLYVDVNERKISTNQFSVTEHAAETNFATSSDLPGVFFYYDLSPINIELGGSGGQTSVDVTCGHCRIRCVVTSPLSILRNLFRPLS